MRYCEKSGACTKEAKWFMPHKPGEACCDDHKQAVDKAKLDRLKAKVTKLESEMAEIEKSYHAIVKA